MNERFYITTPIYYVNDRPHVGHAYTTVAADVFARNLRRSGRDVFFLTGTDEHGSKVAESAKKAGLQPQQFCDRNSQLFLDLFRKLNVTNDDFIRTTEPRHTRAVEHFLNILKENDEIYEGTYEGLYCTACERFYTEKELVNGKCPLHLTVPEHVKEKNYFFKLTKWLDKVKALIESDEIRIEPRERKAETLGFFKQGLEDFSISREHVQWGIPLPWDTSQVTYVWVDALINYLTAVGFPDKQYEQWWPADLHLIGRDILKFHAIFWPALLLAAGLKPPKSIFVHGFFTINGAKMSKSLGNVIDPNLLVERFGVDATRYLLLRQFPFGQDGDISEKRLTEQFNADLANGLGNLASRTATLIDQSGGVKVARPSKPELPHLISHALEAHAPDRGLEAIRQAVATLDGELAEHKPWERAADDPAREKLLAVVAGEILVIADALEPFLPDTAKKLRDHFSVGTITKLTPLFPRVKVD